MSQALDLSADAVLMDRLDHVDELCVTFATTLVHEAKVRDLVGEGMLERVLKLRMEPDLVEELGSLEAVESSTERLIRESGDWLEQRERNVFADNGRHLEEAFVLRREPVDARR